MSVPALRLSTFYFIYFAILGTFLPYWSLYLKQLGFNPDEIGELTALMVATKILAPNIWGWLADKTGKHLLLIRLNTLLSALSFAGFFYQADFVWYAAVTVLFSFFWNAVLAQFEAATLFHLQVQPQRYSRIRLWGSVGFIAGVLGVGQGIDYFGSAIVAETVCVLLVLNWFIALLIPEAKEQKTVHDTGSGWQVLLKVEVIAFFIVYMLLQVGMGPYHVFYSVYLNENSYTASQTGLLWALAVFAEIVLFLFIGSVLKRFSLRKLLLISLALTIFRWFILAYQVNSISWVIFSQLLHAASFGVTHVVAMQLLLKYFGQQHLGKGQALYTSISYGIGGMLGSLYSGYYWDNLGGSLVFVNAALVTGLALLLAFLAVAKFNKVTRQKTLVS